MLTVRVLATGSFALALLFTFCGCSGGVWLRPDGTPGPEDCPSEAQRLMEAMQLHVGDSIKVQLDASQTDARPVTLYDGPVESLVWGFFGTLDLGDRLYGRVSTSGPQIIIRYYQLQRLDGQPIPFCAVARLSGNQYRKLPGSRPGLAVVELSTANAHVVSAFR